MRMRTINKYLNHYGVTFTVGSSSKHSYADYGVYPTTAWPDIPAAQVKTKIIDMPAMDGGLDLSESLTGWPVYKTRKATFTFLVPEERLWEETFTRMRTDLHGRIAQLVRDVEPQYYYSGRLSLEKDKCDRNGGIITVEAQLSPFKWEITNTIDDWLWDPFSFVNGVIRQYGGITVSGTQTVTVVSSPAGGCPVIAVSNLSGTLTVTYNSVTKTITANGNHTFPEFELPHAEEEITFTFAGSATVSIWFRPGVL